MSEDYYSKSENKVLHIAYDDICWKISSNLSGQILDLQSDHKEANTRHLLLAKHAAKGGELCSDHM